MKKETVKCIIMCRYGWLSCRRMRIKGGQKGCLEWRWEDGTYILVP